VGARWARVGPATLFVTKEKRVESFNGTPMNVTEGGTSVDLKYDQIVADSDKNTTISFNVQRGFTLSGYEGTVLEIFYENVTGISTASLFNKAIQTNVSIFFVANDTLDRLDNISIPQGDKDIIKSLVNASSEVFAVVPNGSVQIGNWMGVGYVIVDRNSGTGKYLISGGLNGGSTDKPTPEGLSKTQSCVILALAVGIGAPLVVINVACVVAIFTPEGVLFCTRLFRTERRLYPVYKRVINPILEESWNKCGS
jgi:hypothetical protein